MTSKEAADYLKIHIITLYRMLGKNSIKAARIGGQWRFRQEWLDSMVERKARRSHVD